MSLRAVVFDASTLLEARSPVDLELKELLEKLRRLNFRIAVFSTELVDIGDLMTAWELPPVDLLLTHSDVGKYKGSPLWIDKACEALALSRHELIYIGDSEVDWRTAINSAVMYINAEWTGQHMPKEAFRAQSPMELWLYLSHFFLQPPRWQYSLDSGNNGLHHVRALLNATTTLPRVVSDAGAVEKQFTLQDVLTYERDVQVGAEPAKNILMMHTLSSLYLEGLIPPGVLIASYPSHSASKTEGLLDDWLAPAAKAFHGWYKRDLLVRSEDAPDTSRLRAARHVPTPEMQMSTVHVNPAYRARLPGKTVILLDDFTTEGTSLEWGRQLLQAAGVQRVILVTIGKYGRNRPIVHQTFSLRPGVTLDPFSVSNARFPSVFQARPVAFTEDLSATTILQRSLRHFARAEAFPTDIRTGVLDGS